jgi:hypothetical protein
VKSGGMWQLAHLPIPLKTFSPRCAAAASKLPFGGFGACRPSC